MDAIYLAGVAALVAMTMALAIGCGKLGGPK